jgi:hypothetical protein
MPKKSSKSDKFFIASELLEQIIGKGSDENRRYGWLD